MYEKETKKKQRICRITIECKVKRKNNSVSCELITKKSSINKQQWTAEQIFNLSKNKTESKKN